MTPAKKRIPEGPFNVVLVSFDTLRRDHVHAYGHPKALSPTMDRLAGEGVIFADAVVNCGWTLPQHISLQTGLYPIRHGLVYLRRPKELSRRFATLAELFTDAGYVTLGFGNQNSYGGGWVYGFYRGMGHYTTIFPYNNMMERVVEPVCSAVRLAGSKPFYLYLHTNDTHEPFAASAPFGTQWGTQYPNRYEGEVTYVDHYLGAIVDELGRLGVLDRTLIVVTSDHGSEFQEHGFLEKKLNLYEEISQIPIIMRLPGVLPRGRTARGLCQTTDIPATILDICGLKPPKVFDGQSLLARACGRKQGVPKIVFAHTLHETMFQYEHFSARTDRYKLIRTVPLVTRPERLGSGAGERFARLAEVAQRRRGVWRELYDLKTDPGEQTNLMDRRPKIARDLETKLDRWIRSCDYTVRRSAMAKRQRST